MTAVTSGMTAVWCWHDSARGGRRSDIGWEGLFDYSCHSWYDSGIVLAQ